MLICHRRNADIIIIYTGSSWNLVQDYAIQHRQTLNLMVVVHKAFKCCICAFLVVNLAEFKFIFRIKIFLPFRPNYLLSSLLATHHNCCPKCMHVYTAKTKHLSLFVLYKKSEACLICNMATSLAVWRRRQFVYSRQCTHADAVQHSTVNKTVL